MSLATGDLTTLYTVKQYMDGVPSDAVLNGLISRISRSILSIINRPLLVPRTYSQKFNGTGTSNLVLPYWPVLSLDSMAISGVSVDESPQSNELVSSGSGFGWRYVPWDGLPPGTAANVELVGTWFYSGNQNVVIEYSAGYKVSDESATVPAVTGPYTILPVTPYGIWATDEGVTYANGTPLTAIASGTPTIGKYLPPDPSLATPRLVYTFAAADTLASVLISYGFIPADIEQIAIEIISERADYRKRVGVRSQMLASQESITYDGAGLTSYVERMLEQYVSRIPTFLGANV